MKTEAKNLVLFYFESFLISLLSAYFILLQTSKYGIGLSPDSTTYLRWGESISKEGFVFLIQNHSATFPPLYPAILAIFSNIFHADHISVARWLNAILSFCFTFFSMCIGRKLTKNLALLFVFGLFISFSRPINFVFSYALSESLFIFLILLITFSIEKINYKNLMLCWFLSALAILTRYAGVAIVPAVCLYIFIQKYELSEKIKKCFFYATIPTLTYIAYIARNFYFTRTLMGTRVASNTGLISNFDRAFSTVALWFSGSFYFLAIFLFFVLGAFIWTYKEELLKFFTNLSGTVKFSLSFVLVYLAFIVISSTTTAYDLINDRLMAPVFLSALLLLFSLVVFGYKTPKKEKFLFYLLLSMLVVCTLISFAKAWTKDINFRKNHGAGGYNSEFWQENKLVKNVKKNKLDSSLKIYTNDIYSFFIIDKKIKPLDIAQKKDSELSDFENSFIVYFNNIDQSDTFTLKELQNICEMTIITENIDGFILRINKCSKPTNFENKNG